MYRSIGVYGYVSIWAQVCIQLYVYMSMCVHMYARVCIYVHILIVDMCMWFQMYMCFVLLFPCAYVRLRVSVSIYAYMYMLMGHVKAEPYVHVRVYVSFHVKIYGC